jgi:formylmethanofuran dehydrogenase subunit E
MAELHNLLEQSAALHQHLCPRQVLGVRIGMLAADLLDVELPQRDKRIFVFVETDGCFADGVSVATGCSLGHRTLRLMDYGKVAATFVDTETMRAVRIIPHRFARQRATCYAPNASDHWQAQLHVYQTMPDDELLAWQAVRLTVSMVALISRPGVRVNCALCGEEILNERERIVSGVPVCRSCTGDGYYELETEFPECSPPTQAPDSVTGR